MAGYETRTSRIRRHTMTTLTSMLRTAMGEGSPLLTPAELTARGIEEILYTCEDVAVYASYGDDDATIHFTTPRGTEVFCSYYWESGEWHAESETKDGLYRSVSGVGNFSTRSFKNVIKALKESNQ